MAVRAKAGFNKSDFRPGKPKKTRQGNGRNSLPNHGRKLRRGQGR